MTLGKHSRPSTPGEDSRSSTASKGSRSSTVGKHSRTSTVSEGSRPLTPVQESRSSKASKHSRPSTAGRDSRTSTPSEVSRPLTPTQESRSSTAGRDSRTSTSSKDSRLSTVDLDETELHRRAAIKGLNIQNLFFKHWYFCYFFIGAKLVRFFEANYLAIAARNSKGKTPRDVAIDAGLPDNVHQIGKFKDWSLPELFQSIWIKF